jgi:hypothetical protein
LHFKEERQALLTKKEVIFCVVFLHPQLGSS